MESPARLAGVGTSTFTVECAARQPTGVVGHQRQSQQSRQSSVPSNLVDEAIPLEARGTTRISSPVGNKGQRTHASPFRPHAPGHDLLGHELQGRRDSICARCSMGFAPSARCATL